MPKPDFLKKLALEITKTLPVHLQSFKKDLNDNCHVALKKVFSKLEVVTREEFLVQTKVLARTRKKIEELEKKIKQMEKKKHKT